MKAKLDRDSLIDYKYNWVANDLQDEKYHQKVVKLKNQYKREKPQKIKLNIERYYDEEE